MGEYNVRANIIRYVMVYPFLFDKFRELKVEPKRWWSIDWHVCKMHDVAKYVIERNHIYHSNTHMTDTQIVELYCRAKRDMRVIK